MATHNEPDKRFVGNLLNEKADTATNQYYRQKLLEVAQKCFQELVNDCVDSVLNSVPFEIH